MPRSWFDVQALAPGAAKVALRGIIGDWGITDRDLIAEIEMLGDVKEIEVTINSRGGSVDHALSIFNYLREHPARITTKVGGVAMSAASIVLMAADAGQRIMPSNTLIMMHNPYNPADPETTDEEQLKIIEKFRQLLVETYVAATGRSEEDIRQILDDETWMTADEAKAAGFIDVIEPVTIAGAGAVVMASVMACAMGIPPEVLARVQEIEARAPGVSEGGDPLSDDPAVQAGADPEPACAEPAVNQTLANTIRAMATARSLAEHVAVFALAADIDSPEKAASAMQIACEVRDFCAAVGMADQAPALIAARKSVAEARQALLEVFASGERQAQTQITNHQPNPEAKPVLTAKAVWDKVLPTLAS